MYDDHDDDGYDDDGLPVGSDCISCFYERFSSVLFGFLVCIWLLLIVYIVQVDTLYNTMYLLLNFTMLLLGTLSNSGCKDTGAGGRGTLFLFFLK